ncbi:SCPU domain-containing protein, partial [Acinetobacter baumannii]
MSLNFMNKAKIYSYKKLPRSLKYIICICLFYLVYAFF